MQGSGTCLPLFRLLLIAAGVSLFLIQGALAQTGRQAAAGRPATGTSITAPLRANPDWQSLTPAQRSALGPLEHDWPNIDADRKEKWLEVAAKFPRMSPEEQQRVQGRMTRWARLSPKERGEARLHYQELRQMSPAERQARWEQYKALPPDQRRRLADQAAPGSKQEHANGRIPRPLSAASAPVPKSNMVSPLPPPSAAVKPVAPTVVQARPGATTTLMSKRPNPPVHQQPGLPKVAATPGFVDRSTLLPQRGAQAAGTRAASAAASAPSRP